MMNTMRIRLCGCVIVAAWCVLSVAAVPARGVNNGGAAGTLEDVLVRDEDTMKVTSEKPLFAIDLDPLKGVAGMDESLLNRDDASPRISTGTMAPSLASRAIMSPWLTAVAVDPIMTLPGPAGNPARWKLNIVDTQGKLFRQFSGKGARAGEILWDGRGTNGTFLSVGALYSYFMVTADRSGAKTTSVVRPFRIAAAQHREQDGTHVSLALASVCHTGKPTRALTETGSELLIEAADIIKQYYPRPFIVKVYDKDRDSARRAVVVISSFVAGQLLIPPEQVRTESYQAQANNYRVEIVIGDTPAGRSLYQSTARPARELPTKEFGLKVRYDFAGTQETRGDLSVDYWDAFTADYRADLNTSEQVAAGLTLAGEAVWYLGRHVGAGLGISYQFPRENADRGGMFNYIPLYALLKVRSASTGLLRPYLIGQLGANLFYADTDFSGAGSTKRKGLYYGAGCGVTAGSFQCELIYAGHRASIVRADTVRSELYSLESNEEIDYRALSLSVGYQFY